MMWNPLAFYSSPTNVKNRQKFWWRSPSTEEVTAQYTLVREELQLHKIIWDKTAAHCNFTPLEILLADERNLLKYNSAASYAAKNIY